MYEKQVFGVDVMAVGSDVVLDNFDELANGMKRSFEYARLSPDFSPTRPISCVYQESWDDSEESLRHLLALDLNGNIIGAAFCLLTEPVEDPIDDAGWFYTEGSLSPSFRVLVADTLATHVHSLAVCNGFTELVVRMGSLPGSELLRRRHGYVHSPTPKRPNRWIRKLPVAIHDRWHATAPKSVML